MSPYGLLSRRRYERAVRRAFSRVTFYREQSAAAGRLLTDPVPTSLAALPQPPHSLCPIARPWSADREPSLWTPELRPLARALWLAGCRERLPVLEVRESLLDTDRLPWRGLRPGPAYRVLLSPTAKVAAGERRAGLDRVAFGAVEAAGGGWIVGSQAELADLPAAYLRLLRPVPRLPVVALGQRLAPAAEPALLYEPHLGYLGALVPECGRFHLDPARVYPRVRGGVVTLSLPRSRRPTLLDIVPPGAERVTIGRCGRHRGPILLACQPAGQPGERQLSAG